MIVKPATNFLTKLNDARLAQAIANIIAAMTNNPAYDKPVPTLEAISALLSAFIAALAAAANRGKEQIAAKNAQRVPLADAVRALALYVAGSCNGDLACLISSGFPIQKPTRSRIGMLPAPETPVVTQGKHSGELDAATGAVSNGISYMWRIAKASAPETVVQLHPATSSRYTFKDLIPGEIYIVTVAVLGAAGVSEWSNGGQRMVI